MTARMSRAVEDAIALHATGLSIRKAAKAAGVAASSLMRALQRIRKVEQVKDKPA